MPYNILVDASAVVATLGVASGQVKPVLVEQLVTVSDLVKAEMERRANVGVTGALRNTVGYKFVPETLTSEIKPSAPYSDAVETGTRPHWISAKAGSPLEQWAAMKGINVYALQHSIAVKGTQPHPFIEPTYIEMAPIVAEKFAAGMAAFTEKVNHASL